MWWGGSYPYMSTRIHKKWSSDSSSWAESFNKVVNITTCECMQFYKLTNYLNYFVRCFRFIQVGLDLVNYLSLLSLGSFS